MGETWTTQILFLRLESYANVFGFCAWLQYSWFRPGIICPNLTATPVLSTFICLQRVCNLHCGMHVMCIDNGNKNEGWMYED